MEKEYTVEKLDHYCRGIIHRDEKIGFIDNALPNEKIQIEITNEKKKYFEGIVKKYNEVSPFRIKPLCPYFFKCGGCSSQHIPFAMENNYKEEKVRELIAKFTDIDLVVIKNIEYGEEFYYRNKIKLHIKNKKIGYYEEESNELLEINKCCLVSFKINSLFEELENVVKNNEIEEIIIRVSNDEKRVMLKLVGNVFNYGSILDKVDVLYINDNCITNKDQILTNIGNKKYYLSIDSFFQVNIKLTEKLYDEVLKIVSKYCPETILDLYCGTGTIGIYVSDYVKKIIGVDYSITNINDAMKNAKLNNLYNIEFICDKVENVIDSFKDIDLVIVDPPRAGLDIKTKENLKRIGSKYIIYVSCDPVTLARDLDYLSANYEVKYIKPFNMFPKTYHVECVCLLIFR